MSGGEYVVAAYGVVLFALLVYVVVVGLKSARQARETELLARLIDARADAGEPVMEEASTLGPVDR